MTAEQLWSKFAEKNGIKHNEYEAWQFGDAPDKLAELVLRGIKTVSYTHLTLPTICSV